MNRIFETYLWLLSCWLNAQMQAMHTLDGTPGECKAYVEVLAKIHNDVYAAYRKEHDKNCGPNDFTLPLDK